MDEEPAVLIQVDAEADTARRFGLSEEHRLPLDNTAVDVPRNDLVHYLPEP